LFLTVDESDTSNQHTGSLFVESEVELDAVGPPVNIALLTEVALSPCLVIGFPTDL